jgi:rhodanese-related sulfurtransferase
MELTILQASEVHTRRSAGEAIDLLDVRTPLEYREIHATGAELVPLDRLDPATFKSRAPGRLLAVICKSGGRAKQACEKLAAAGIRGLILVEGGTTAWAAAGLPVQRGKKGMSLERQVRIAAGTLAFAGAVLGFVVHPYFFGLSGFVGAGLMFAGITDTCAMGMLIAKMPWNQVKLDKPAPQCQTKPANC